MPKKHVDECHHDFPTWFPIHEHGYWRLDLVNKLVRGLVVEMLHIGTKIAISENTDISIQSQSMLEHFRRFRRLQETVVFLLQVTCSYEFHVNGEGDAWRVAVKDASNPCSIFLPAILPTDDKFVIGALVGVQSVCFHCVHTFGFE